jgi:hypothetical protein
MRSISTFMFVVFPLLAGCPSDTKLGTFNSPPTASITSHADGDTVMAGQELNLLGNVSDADNGPESLAVTWIVGGLHVCVDAVANETGVTNCVVIV